MSTSSRQARRLLVIVTALLAAACSVTPSASPEPPAPTTSATATASASAPTPTRTPAPLGAAWSSIDVGAGQIAAIAHGDAGYVAVGSTGCPDGCPGSAGAWFSADGVSWSSVTIPDGDDFYLHTVATDGTTWYAAGDRLDQTGLVQGRIWRSTDARTWQLIRSFEVGRCGEGCPSIGMLAARPGSALLSSPFGLVGATADGYLLAVGKIAWETGGAGDLVHRVDFIADFQGGAIVTDGRRVVILHGLCGDTDCFTRSWTSADGRTSWVPTDQPLPIPWTEPPLLVVSGGSFFTAGHRPTAGVGVFTSTDGLAWTEIRANLAIGDSCKLVAMSGTDAQLVVASDCGTGLWVSQGR